MSEMVVLLLTCLRNYYIRQVRKVCFSYNSVYKNKLLYSCWPNCFVPSCPMRALQDCSFVSLPYCRDTVMSSIVCHHYIVIIRRDCRVFRVGSKCCQTRFHYWKRFTPARCIFLRGFSS